MFTIYMGELVGPRFGKVVSKIQDWQVSSRNRVYLLQLHLPKYGREGLKLVSKMGFKKWNTNFRLEHSDRENRTTFSDVPLLPEIFHRNDPKRSAPLTFQPGFPQTFCQR